VDAFFIFPCMLHVRSTYNVVVFPFAFHIAVQQPLKPLWSRLLLCDHEPFQTSTVLCLMSLLMSLLQASGEILSEFPSPRVILSFFLHPWPYRLGWPCQEIKLPPASLSVTWGVLGPLTTSRWQPFFLSPVEKIKWFALAENRTPILLPFSP
jgi:hypothetical protein